MIPDWLGPRRGTSRLMYLAHPTRKSKLIRARIEEFAKSIGYYGINPFRLGEDMEFDPYIDRGPVLNLDLNVQRGTGCTGILGISAGVMGEARDRIEWDRSTSFRICRRDRIGDFDELWDAEYDRLSRLSEYGDVFADIRKKFRRLFIFVGPSGVGKTYCIGQISDYFGLQNFQQIKTVTTRPVRENKDNSSYYIVTPEEFRIGVEHHAFHDYDEYIDASYGSSLDEVKRVLRQKNGMFALTPKGAKAYYDCSEELDVTIIFLKPESDSVLLNNFRRRKEFDEALIMKKMAKAKDFVVPSGIRHEVIVMTGTSADRQRILDKVSPLVK